MSFANVGNVLGQLMLISTRLDTIGQQARDMPKMPVYDPGDKREEPNSARNVQDLSAVPPGYARSPTGGLIPTGGVPDDPRMRELRGGVGPGMSTGSGWDAGAAGAVNPGISIPADYSEGARQRREQRAGAWNEAAAAQVIAQLKELIARLTEVFGGPTHIGGIIEQEIRNLEAKVVSPDEALAFIRYILSTLYAGLQQEALSPVANIRNIANDLLRFAGGAGLPGGPGGLPDSARTLTGPRGLAPSGPGPSAPGRETTAGRTTTGGFGGATGAATREDLVGLGATITRASREQADRFAAGIPTPQEVAEAVRTRLNPDLRQFYDQAAAFSEEAQRNLSMTLERFAASGALAPGAR